MYRAGMTTKLVEQKLELNSALLKVVEKDGAIERLLKQLQSECRTLTCLPLSCGPAIIHRPVVEGEIPST
jgi:hypothetical protein